MDIWLIFKFEDFKSFFQGGKIFHYAQSERKKSVSHGVSKISTKFKYKIYAENIICGFKLK